MIPAGKASVLTWVSNDTQQVKIDGWLSDTRGARGGILVLESIHILAKLNITTAAGVSIAGADMANFIKKLKLADVAGDRRWISGFKVRMLAHNDLGAKAPADPATHAAATTQDDTFEFVLQFTQQEAFRDVDYALPVHDMIGGSLTIQMPANADIPATGGTPTINSGTYTCYANFRELRPNDKQFFVRDVVEEHSQTSNTDLYLPANGRLIKEAWIMKEGVGGGTSITAIADSSIQPFKEYSIDRAAKKRAYLNQKNVNTAQDPVYNDKAYPVIVPRAKSKIYDYPNVGGSLLVKVTNPSVTNPDVMVRYIAPKDQRQMEIAAARMGVRPGAAYGVKTKGKTKRDPKEWGPLASFLPAKAHE